MFKKILTLLLLINIAPVISAEELSFRQIERLLCRPGYKLQKEGCFNPKTYDYHFVMLSTNGHICPSKYTIKYKNYCIPNKVK